MVADDDQSLADKRNTLSPPLFLFRPTYEAPYRPFTIDHSPLTPFTLDRHALPIPHFARLFLVRGHRRRAAGLSARSTATLAPMSSSIGGGFTGLSAAAHLAKAGVDVALIEAHRFGDGASGRNGGQLGTGQRAWAEELEAELRLRRAPRRCSIWPRRPRHIFSNSRGQRHRDRLHARPAVGRAQEALSSPTIRRMPTSWRRASAIRISPSWTPPRPPSGSARRHYFGGTRDTGTGHIHPLKLVIGTARVAAAAGAHLFETTQDRPASHRPAARCG